MGHSIYWRYIRLRAVWGSGGLASVIKGWEILRLSFVSTGAHFFQDHTFCQNRMFAFVSHATIHCRKQMFFSNHASVLLCRVFLCPVFLRSCGALSMFSCGFVPLCPCASLPLCSVPGRKTVTRVCCLAGPIFTAALFGLCLDLVWVRETLTGVYVLSAPGCFWLSHLAVQMTMAWSRHPQSEPN